MNATGEGKSVASLLRKNAAEQRQELNNKAEINRWRLSRRATRVARERLREAGDLNSAELLLRHSIAYGHPRLVVRRYLLACALGLKDPERYKDFFLSATDKLEAGDLASAYDWAKRTAESFSSIAGLEAPKEMAPLRRDCL